MNNNDYNPNNNANKFKSFLASTGGRVLLTVILAILIYGIMFALTATDNEYIALITAVVCGFIGWRALNRITPSVFLWMSWMGWIIYFIIKGLLSVFIGVFIAPFVIGKKISDAVSNSIQNQN